MRASDLLYPVPPRPPPVVFPEKVWREEGYDERDRAREDAARQEAAAEARRAREEFEARKMQQRVEKGGAVKTTQATVVEVRRGYRNEPTLFSVFTLLLGV